MGGGFLHVGDPHLIGSRTKPVERARILHEISRLIERDKESLGRLESQDTGKPLKQGLSDATAAARYFEFYANNIESLYGDTIPLGPDTLSFTTREPYGVTAHIVPWNYPLQISSRPVAPSLAVGNCVVLKPAEDAPLAAIKIGELALEAGLPPGALNVVPGLGDEAGFALASHPGIDHLAFTGSPVVGKIVGKAAAENLIPLALELGGKSPNIVFPDADLDICIPTVVNSIIQNAGQTCSAGSRLLVHEDIHDQVVEAVAERFQSIAIGRGLDEPDLGPIISQKQLTRVNDYVQQAKGSARLVTGGTKPSSDALQGGYFFEPTLFADVEPNAPLARDEVFGPVLATTKFRDIDEAVTIANGTDFGLIAAVWTRDVSTAHKVASQLQVGQVFINNYGAGGGVELPFGGFKKCGHGREKGYEALNEYSQLKTTALKFA